MTLWWKAAALAAVRALKGRVEWKKDDDGKKVDTIEAIAITAEPAELDAFFAKPEAVGLFTILMRYRKVE